MTSLPDHTHPELEYWLKRIDQKLDALIAHNLDQQAMHRIESQLEDMLKRIRGASGGQP